MRCGITKQFYIFLRRVVPMPSSFYRIFKNTLLIQSFFVELTTTSYNFFKPYLVLAKSLKQLFLQGVHKLLLQFSKFVKILFFEIFSFDLFYSEGKCFKFFLS